MRMNRKQLAVLWCGIVVIAVMCFYVPWTSTLPPGYPKEIYDDYLTQRCGYEKIFYLGGDQRIDYGRLGLQCGVVAVITAGLILTFRRTSKGAL